MNARGSPRIDRRIRVAVPRRRHADAAPVPCRGRRLGRVSCCGHARHEVAAEGQGRDHLGRRGDHGLGRPARFGESEDPRRAREHVRAEGTERKRDADHRAGDSEPLVAEREDEDLRDDETGDGVQRERPADVDPEDAVDADTAVATPEVQVEVHVRADQDTGGAHEQQGSTGAHRTTTVPVIDGWMLHRYANVPAVVSVTTLLAPLRMSPVSNDPSVALNVCVTPSVFLTVMLVPLVTVRVRGANVKFSITIAFAAGCAPAAATEALGPAITRVSASAAIATIGTASATRAMAGFRDVVTVEASMLVPS